MHFLPLVTPHRATLLKEEGKKKNKDLGDFLRRATTGPRSFSGNPRDDENACRRRRREESWPRCRTTPSSLPYVYPVVSSLPWISRSGRSS